MTSVIIKIVGDTKIKITHHDNGEEEFETPYVDGKKQGAGNA